MISLVRQLATRVQTSVLVYRRAELLFDFQGVILFGMECRPKEKLGEDLPWLMKSSQMKRVPQLANS